MRGALFLVITLFTGSIFAETEALPGSLRSKIDVFFQDIQDGEVEAAYQKMVKGSLISEKAKQLQNLINQTHNAISIYGSIGSYEQFSVSSINNFIIKAVYISKNENFPLRWLFVFYKSSEEWVLIAVEFDDDIEALFESM